MTLSGKRILVVEDEPIIAFALEDMLVELGCVVIGPAMQLAEAEQLAVSAELDAAILDVNINAARSYDVAAVLERRGVPFAFATGYDADGLDWNGRTAELLGKPYRKDQVEAALIRLVDRQDAP